MEHSDSTRWSLISGAAKGERAEFKAALKEVVEVHHPGERRSVERECARILECFE